jgi:Ca-activated chloride channel homolog
MTTTRSHLVTAAALLLATAVAGVAARGAGHSPAAAPASGPATFAAPRTGRVSFSGTLDRSAVLVGRDGLARMELVISATPDDAARTVRRPTDVVIVLDRSGSMMGEKMTHARAAVRELLAQLGPDDRFALVTYSDQAVIAVGLAPVDDAARAAWIAALSDVQPSGGTNMASGLDLGIDMVEQQRVSGRVPRVILISDGLANQGDATPEGLMRRARRAAQGEYMMSTVGVGTDFNQFLMTALADAGTGNYYYVHDPRELPTVFAREFDAARTTVASGLAVQIQPANGVRVVDAAGYPLETAGDAVVIRPGALFAGQERRIWVTLGVPQQAVGDYTLGQFSLSYGDGRERTTLRFTETPRIACVQNEEQFFAGVDQNAWARSVVVDAYNEMQQDVAREVQAGRRDEALHRLQAFTSETSSLNAHFNSAPVANQLRSASKLEAEVKGAFVGADQAQRQNELSKAVSADAVDARRAGSKK